MFYICSFYKLLNISHLLSLERYIPQLELLPLNLKLYMLVDKLASIGLTIDIVEVDIRTPTTDVEAAVLVRRCLIRCNRCLDTLDGLTIPVDNASRRRKLGLKLRVAHAIARHAGERHTK